MQSKIRFALAAATLICAFAVSACGQSGSADNVDDYQNAYQNVQPPNGQQGWFWVYDTGTDCCIVTSDTSSYPVSSPSLDGHSRLFYVDWKAKDPPNGTPGERYSTSFGNSEGATHFVYDIYIYLKDPKNVQNIEMDTNQVWDNNGDVLIYGLQCAHSTPVGPSWQYTESDLNAQNPQPKWVTPNPQWQTPLACDPWSWSPNTWHHVQLQVHQDANTPGAAYYDSITFDGTTTPLTGWSGNSSFPRAWKPIGNLLLNFQLDGIDNGGNPATITAYIDKFNLSWY